MKTLTHRLYISPRYSKAVEWVRLVSITGFAQFAIQGLGFISGILIIRLLPTKEYALYTLANTMLATMVVLADSGIGAGVMAQGGRVWQNPKKFGSVIATGLDLRRKFAVGSLLIASPILLYLLLHHDAGWLVAVLIILALIPAFLAALSGELLEIGPKLQQDIVPLQRIQVLANAGRLALVCLTIFVFPWAFLAILTAGMTQLWANSRLRIISAKYIGQQQKPDPVVRRDILVVVKRHLPSAVYYCLSGQITIWLVSAFGSTAAIAQVGALGRLAMILSLLTILFSTLVIPRFARLPADAGLLLKRFIQLMLGWLLICVLVVGFVWLFSTQILWVLGPNYTSLKNEAVLMMAGSCLSLMAGSSFSLYMSRGWVLNPVISILVNLIAISLGALLIDVSTLQGVLWLNILIASIQTVTNIFYAILSIRSM